MNVLKIQQELLKAVLTDRNRVSYYNQDSEHIFVTVNGQVGYILPTSELYVELTAAQMMVSDLITDQIEEAMKPANRLEGTDEYRIGGTVRKYVWAEDKEETAYFNTALLKNFDNPELYKAKLHPSSLAVVTENGIGADERKVVGIVMPYNIKAI